MKEYIEPVEHLAEMFRHLPGIGRKTAIRLAFAVLDFPEQTAREFADAIIAAKTEVGECRECFNIADSELCSVCSDITRDRTTVCVVEDARAVIAIERSHSYHGLYHVLHGAISPMLGIGPNDIKLKELIMRLQGDVKEVIIATNSSLEGETTAMYIGKLIKPTGIKVTRIASGVPVGGDLEYIDEVTLLRALEGRTEL